MNKLKTLRESADITQNEIAIILGVSRTSVSMWETGQAMPRADKLPKLAKILGCTVDDLLRDAG